MQLLKQEQHSTTPLKPLGRRLFGNPFLPKELGFDADAWFATPEIVETSKDSLLEVTVFWQGGILDVGHYKTPRRLTFGSDPRADFCYPLYEPSNNPQKKVLFPLIQPGNRGFLLCFEPEMQGTVEQNGECFTLLELVKVGKAHDFNRSGMCYYPLLPGVTVRLDFNGLEIRLEFVSSFHIHPSHLRRLDSSYAPVLSFSILLHLFFALMAILSSNSSNSPASLSNKASVQKLQTQQTAPFRSQHLP